MPERISICRKYFENEGATYGTYVSSGRCGRLCSPTKVPLPRR